MNELVPTNNQTRQQVVLQQDRSVDIFAAEPEEQLKIAAKWASALQNVVKEQKLAISFGGQSEHWPVEVWQTFAMFAGVHAREVDMRRYDNGTWEAKVEIVRNRDKTVVADGSAICGVDEPTWAKKPEYARRSMAITRATGKAYRSAFSFITVLAGYNPTPAEEMPGYEPPIEGYIGSPEQSERLESYLKSQNIPKDKWSAVADKLTGKKAFEWKKIVESFKSQDHPK
jgi:hypothetical protein